MEKKKMKDPQMCVIEISSENILATSGTVTGPELNGGLHTNQVLAKQRPTGIMWD